MIEDDSIFELQHLQDIWDDLISQYKQTLRNQDHKASGELINTSKGLVEYDGRYIKFIISAPEYWKYVEYGRKPGKRPPINDILKWVKIKGLPRSNYGIKKNKGKLPTEKQLAFLISRSIGLKGIKPSNALTNTLKKYKLEQQVKEYISASINRSVEKIISELNEQI